MAVCVAHGISHSHFLGGPPVWTPLDREKAIWWEIYRRKTCTACGTRADEWDPGEGGRDDAYRTEIHKCWGCEAKGTAEKDLTEKDGFNVRALLIKNTGA